MTSKRDAEPFTSAKGGVGVGNSRSQQVGSFRFTFDDERWEWSEVVQQMHGYQPGAMPNPTTKIVLSHKHPDDRIHVAAILDETRRTRSAFSTRHRIVDARGDVHSVVVVADLLADDTGHVVGTHGFYIDLQGAVVTEQQIEDRITAAVVGIADRREAIEHAKGMLMLLYDIDADAAFELLRWRSQETNVKLRTFALQLIADFRAMGGEQLPPRRDYDRCVMTVHDRVQGD